MSATIHYHDIGTKGSDPLTMTISHDGIRGRSVV